ncbi:MAG: c-type cytochrome [Pseudomonadota bacterium]
MVKRNSAAWLMAGALALAPAAGIASDPPGAGGDPKKGAKVIRKCVACHDIKTGRKKVGPSLVGVFGRKAAAAKGYRYSSGIKAAAEKGVVWNEESLFNYLADPKKFLKSVVGKSVSNKMTYKLKKEDQRRDVIAFIKEKLNK